ncbi:unnamed protein product [Paramecium sonneborni]|uniref:Uncharacterized protein n=1 Tax=Paramecium sonneborni TaxID=65129 RepID=A0A8S1PMG1_9CILI|nr:unnamed protein product [Paramecium sonneborni]
MRNNYQRKLRTNFIIEEITQKKGKINQNQYLRMRNIDKCWKFRI